MRAKDSVIGDLKIKLELSRTNIDGANELEGLEGENRDYYGNADFYEPASPRSQVSSPQKSEQYQSRTSIISAANSMTGKSKGSNNEILNA